MVESLNFLIPLFALASHVLLVILFFAILSRNSWGKEIVDWLGKYATGLALIVSLLAVITSLYYSEIVGYVPCVLCWWQRVFIYPLIIIFGVALWKKISTAFLYAVPLALLGTLVALYHTYSNLSGNSLLPCTAVEGACAKIYVMAFGYITIPSMSLTVFLYILLLAWAHRIYDKNSNT